ncbi:MAG: hypothetical protein QXG05_07060 [Nitrososphaerota archaeon]
MMIAISDLEHDHYVFQMKSVICRINPAADVYDIWEVSFAMNRQRCHL